MRSPVPRERRRRPLRFLEEARAAAGEARALTRRLRAAGFGARRKPDGTFVTDVDTAVERALRDRLARAFPGHGIIGEELADREARR